MLQQILQTEQLYWYLLTAEGLLLLLLQLRTNSLLKRSLKLKSQRKEAAKQLKEEVRNGTSEIPVIKFEKTKESGQSTKRNEKKGGYDQKELAVLQEMMTEFFG